MKKVIGISLLAITMIACGGEESGDKSDKKDDKKELSKVDKIAEEFCGCMDEDKTLEEIMSCAGEVRSKYEKDLTDEENKEIGDKVKGCSEVIQKKFEEKQAEEAAAVVDTVETAEVELEVQ